MRRTSDDHACAKVGAGLDVGATSLQPTTLGGGFRVRLLWRGAERPDGEKAVKLSDVIAPERACSGNWTVSSLRLIRIGR